jgi:hypothetical protein
MRRVAKLSRDCKRRSSVNPVIIPYMAGQTEVYRGRPSVAYLLDHQQIFKMVRMFQACRIPSAIELFAFTNRELDVVLSVQPG